MTTRANSQVPEVPEVLVLVDRSERIATLTLNRPKARNALSTALSKAIRIAMAEAEANPDVDVIILTGTDPAFCAGVDLKELGSTGGNINVGMNSNAPIEALHPWVPTTKPVIGAINGVAITGGFELALNCDFLVASERASFGDTHTRVGVLPGWGLSVLLPQAIGLRRSIEMSLTGNFMSATEALQFGLVNHVVAHDDLLAATRKLATDIVGNAPAAVRELLVSYRAIHRMTVGDGEIHEARVGRDWLTRTFDPAAVEARRTAIVDRGRKQV
jgi:enoyl-CoA hydratase